MQFLPQILINEASVDWRPNPRNVNLGEQKNENKIVFSSAFSETEDMEDATNLVTEFALPSQIDADVEPKQTLFEILSSNVSQVATEPVTASVKLFDARSDVDPLLPIKTTKEIASASVTTQNAAPRPEQIAKLATVFAPNDVQETAFNNAIPINATKPPVSGGLVIDTYRSLNTEDGTAATPVKSGVVTIQRESEGKVVQNGQVEVQSSQNKISLSPAREGLFEQKIIQLPSEIETKQQTRSSALPELAVGNATSEQPRRSEGIALSVQPRIGANLGANTNTPETPPLFAQNQSKTGPVSLPLEKSNDAPQEGRALARDEPSEYQSKRPKDSVSIDPATVKNRSSATAVEVLYYPKKDLGPNGTQTNPNRQEDLTGTVVRNTENTVRAEIAGVALLQKSEGSRRESRTLQTGLVKPTITNDTNRQAQQQASAKQALPKPHLVAEAPAFPTANVPASEFSSFTESEQAREGSVQLSVEGPDNRREVATQTKGDVLARNAVQQLSHAAKNLGSGGVEVKLAPEELGKVRLSLNPGETNVTVHISAERPETMDLIRRNIDLFSQSLKQEGFTNLSFSFGDSRGNQTQAQNDETKPKFSDETFDAIGEGTPKTKPKTLIAGQLDIRI